MGKFKPPTLRNIAVTAPYMHDGSVASLEDVLSHYEAGGRTVAEGPYKGVGHDNPNKSPTIRGFSLTPGNAPTCWRSSARSPTSTCSEIPGCPIPGGDKRLEAQGL